MVLIMNNRSVQSTAIFNSSNAMSANLYSAVANTKEYLSLKEENRRLADEVAFLRNQLKSSYDIIGMQAPQFMKHDSLFRKKYFFKNAKVINGTTNLNKNFLTLNIGSKEGIEQDYAIINSQGVVGVVKDVSPNFCTALSVLHTEQVVNCKIKKDGVFGPLSWDGKDYRYSHMTEVPTYSKVAKGDTIVTSSLSSIFPEDIMVGIVESVIRKPGEAFYTLTVRLNTDFKKLNYVTIVGNKYKDEQDSLEQALKTPVKKK
jgi:rod shape-determining protein MreC